MSDVKPFLRWAGGKRWLLGELNSFLPKNGFKKYHEPFLGGGAVFFYLNAPKSYLSDLNSELIDTYIAVREDPNLVIRYLKGFRNTKNEYYYVREKEFKSDFKRAAKFIYLNQTSFNGIYRVNLSGNYNVPYGYRKNVEFDYENIKLVSKALGSASLAACHYYETLGNIEKGDLVFIDPPYTVTHNHNGFVHYNSKIFSLDEQYRLREYISEIKKIGAYYILTNAAHPRIKKIFNMKDKIIEMKRASTIGGKNAKRGVYAELIMTNGACL